MASSPHPDTVDDGVCGRQGIGAAFRATREDKAKVAALLEGKLVMSPHKEWALPREIDWTLDPFKQRNWRFQLHTLRWLDPLRRAGLNGDEAAAELWLHYCTSWIDENLSGSDPYAWMDMADGLRAIEFVLGYPLVPEARRGKWIEAILVHARWLADLDNRGHGNHALHQLQGLLVAASFLRDEALKDQARKQIIELFDLSYDVDGVNNEAALGYHDLNYVWWKEVISRFSAENVDLSALEGRLVKGRHMLVHGVRPNGFLEMIGDTSDRKRMSSDGLPETTYMRTNGEDGHPPGERSVLFEAGYLFGRSGWGEYERDFSDETFYSVRFGPDDAIHGHQDSTSVTAYSHGVQWFVDPGMFAYTQSAVRGYVKSRNAHNVVISDRAKFDPKARTVLEAHSLTDRFDHIRLTSSPQRGFSSSRRVVFDRTRDVLIVIDRVRRTDPAIPTTRFTQLWHLHPETSVTRRDRGAVDLASGSATASIRWLDGVRPDSVEWADGEQGGWFSPGYNVAEVAPVIAARSTVRGKLEWCTVISFGDEVFTPIELVDDPEGAMVLTLSEGTVESVLQISDSGVSEGPAGSTDRSSQLISLGESGSATSVQGVRSTFRELADWDLTAATDAHCVEHGYSEDSVSEAIEEFRGRLAGVMKDGRPNYGILGSLGDYESYLRGRSTSVTAGSVQGDRAPLYLAGEQPIALDEMGAVSLGMEAAVSRAFDGPHSRTRIVGVRRVGGLAIPYGVIPGDGDTLLVLFHGAIRRERTALPRIAGYGVAAKLGLPTLAVADATLDLDPRMTLGWYLGSANCDLPAEVAQDITDLCEKRGFSTVLLCGSSGGGFAAMATACHIDSVRTRVLAFNPQTDVRRYYPEASERAIGAVFGDTQSDGIAERVNIASLASAKSSEFHIDLVQNSGDRFHIRYHTAPMLSELPESITVQVTEIDQGPGHQAASSTLIMEHVRRVLGT